MINKLKEVLKNNREEIEVAYPSVWFDHNSKDKEIKVNPYDAIIKAIESIETNNLDEYNNSKKCSHPGEWIKNSTIYSAIVRSSTAYDHNSDKKLEDYNHIRETGTFLKSLLILPYLKKIGVDVFYMLPITKYSLKNKKGDLGSPYGVSNFYKIDEKLDDPLLKGELSLEDQFKCFVEACHKLGIKVIIDIIPRTNATENEFIVSNPEWFYWISTESKKTYKPPFVEEFGRQWVSHTVENLNVCYQDKSVKEHISKFITNPGETFKEEWKQFQQDFKDGKVESILDEVEKRFKVTTAPAFSDGINDPQPAWTDITFFRMYMDHPKDTKHNVSEEQAPYILFDTIKSNLFPGEKPNMELWNMLSDVIPYYQNEFGIDGARIDMGHALPHALTELIINKARKIDKNFCFIAEEMNSNNAQIAKDAGYNLIIGDEFMSAYKFKEFALNDFIEKSKGLALPMFAAAETHDTGRIAAKDGGKELATFVTLLNMLIPNTVPFINSGQEIYELQPINTGIDCRPNEAEMLDKNDPYFGKLALFDKYQFHYDNDRFLYKKLIELNDLKVNKEFNDITLNENLISFAGKEFVVVGNNSEKDCANTITGTQVFTSCDNDDVNNLKAFELKIFKK